MEAIDWTHKPESNGLEELGDLWLWGMSFMQKSLVRAGPGNLVGRKQNKQFNRENKDWPMAFSKAWVHWDFSGCPRKDCIKEDPCKANRPRKKASLPLHTGEGLHSFPFNLFFQGKSLFPTDRSSKQWPTQPKSLLRLKGGKVENSAWVHYDAMDICFGSQNETAKASTWQGSQVRSLPPAGYLSRMRSHSWDVQGLVESIRSPQLCPFCSGEWHALRHIAASWSRPSLLFVPQAFYFQRILRWENIPSMQWLHVLLMWDFSLYSVITIG